MASLLSTLGITNTAAPDPSTYTNIKAETANLAEAKTELNSILSNIRIATNAAQLAGLPPSYTESLTALSNEATSAANSNMTSAQIAAKNTEIAAKMAELKEQQKLAVRQQSIDDMEAAVKTITERLNVIRADQRTSPELLEKYETLYKNAEAALVAVKAPPEAKKEGSESEPPALTYLTAAQYLDELDSLDTLKDAEEKKDFNWSRLAKRILGWTMYFAMIISLIIGFLFGGIIMSNSFAEDKFWAIKIYYFIYGAALFPISISMGAVAPPYWVSTFIPLFLTKNVPGVPMVPMVPRVPVVPGAAPAPPKSPTAGILSALRKIPGLPQFGGSSEPSTGGLFSYQLVDPKNPTATQKLWKNILRGISISEIVLLLGVSVYYRLDKILLTNIQKIINTVKK